MERTNTRGMESARLILDPAHQAWIVGCGVFDAMTSDRAFDDAQMRQIMRRLTDSGEFPSGPMRYASHVMRRVTEDHQCYALFDTMHGIQGMRQHIGFSSTDVINVAFTRGPRPTVADLAPGDILLADAEALLLDLLVATTTAAATVGYVGPCTVTLDVHSAVLGHPLRLRSYDEALGELMPLDAAPESFERVVLHLDVPPTVEQVEEVAWEGALELARRFGVARPQLLTPPGPVRPTLLAG